MREGRPLTPSLKDQAIALARKKGVVGSKEFKALGITRYYLSRMCGLGLLVRIGRGLYGIPVIGEDADAAGEAGPRQWVR